MDSLSVEHVATTTSGGAGIAASRLHQALEGISRVDSHITTLYDDKYSGDYLRYVLNHAPIAHKLLTDRLDRKFTPTWLPHLRNPTFRSDIVHLHWIAGYLAPGTIESIDSPIVWTLHDMWPLTGGCHYAEECDRFVRRCGRCPALDSDSGTDISNRQIRAYQGALSDKTVYYIAPSKWMARQAEESSIVDGPVEIIPNCLDTDLFSPTDQEKARKQLSIPTDVTVILVGGANLKDHRKGGDLLADILQQLTNYVNLEQTIVLQFGSEPIENIPFEYRSLGWVDLSSLSLVYSSADVMAVPSRYESFGQTAAESSACGTPVVAFDTSGIRDVVHDGETGLLAKCYDTRGFSQRLAEILTDEIKRSNMKIAARELAKSTWSYETVAEKYNNIYTTVN